MLKPNQLSSKGGQLQSRFALAAAFCPHNEPAFWRRNLSTAGKYLQKIPHIASDCEQVAIAQNHWEAWR